MTTTDSANLEARRLAIDTKLRRRELDLETKRLELESKHPWWQRSIPWLAPTLSALIATITLIVSSYQNEQDRIAASEAVTAEAALLRMAQQEEARRELDSQQIERETQIILQATKDVSLEQSRLNLLFFSRLELLSVDESVLLDIFDEGVIPQTGVQSQSFHSRRINYKTSDKNVYFQIKFGGGSVGSAVIKVGTGLSQNVSANQKINLGPGSAIAGETLYVAGIVSAIEQRASTVPVSILISGGIKDEKIAEELEINHQTSVRFQYFVDFE